MMSLVSVAAAMAGHDLGKEMAEKDLYVVEGSQRFQVNGLSHAPVFRVLHNRREILGGNKRLIGLEQPSSHRLNVEPVKPFPSLFAKAVI
jgi:hypothetical protein